MTDALVKDTAAIPLKWTTLPNGTIYAAIHFSADKGKDQKWEHNEVNNKGVPLKTWKQEMGMHEDVYDGEPVFADYSDARHCPLSIRENGIPIFKKSVYIGCWDNGLTPAFALIQITTAGQIQVILEVTTTGDDPSETFVPRVIQGILGRVPEAFDYIYHVGDPSIWNRTPTTGESQGMYIRRRFGVNIRRSTNIWQVRRSAVTRALVERLEDGASRFIIDALNCPILRQGFQGAYQMEISTKGDTVGTGRILVEPLKNGYSHVQDALQYGIIAAYKYLEGKLNITQELMTNAQLAKNKPGEQFVPKRPR